MIALLTMLLAQNEWIYFESRETAHAPALVVDGKSIEAEADCVLISYLADRAFGGMKRLSISLGDTNRALVKFDLGDVKLAKKAEIVFTMGLSENPPLQPFELGLYRCTREWTEARTDWRSQPAYDATPAATVRVQPKAGEVRIDATALVAAWIRDGNHGCVVKVTDVRAGPEGNPEKSQQLERRLLALLPWEKTVSDAMDRAEDDGKLVLAIVRSDEGFSELMLLAVVLAHPETLALVRAKYVPVRVAVSSSAYFGRGGSDPLKALGTSLRDVKAPAIVIANAKGECVASLASLGTFDAEMVLRLLGGKLSAKGGTALMRQGRFAEARAALTDEKTDESAYWLACLDWRDREPRKAMAAWEALAGKESPWALKAQARATWPERLAMYESLTVCAEPGRTTEVPAKVELRAIERAFDALVAMQLADGTWPLGEAEMYRAAVTALCARALFAWTETLAGERQARGRDALARADRWLRAYVESADPKTANAWGGAYVLDYFLDTGTKPAVQKAIALLLGGQCPNGGWSYDQRFGTSWRGGIGSWPKTDKGRVHSMNTGPALVSLAWAKKAGFDVDAAALERGVKALLEMRTSPGVFTYTFPEPRTFETLHQSIGRAAACEQALLMLDAGKQEDLDLALAEFMKRRGELRLPVKLTAGWVSSVGSSSYFYHFAYYHAARALADHGGKAGRASLRALSDDLLAVVEADGTWVDFPQVGKAYGTAMALLVLRQSR